MTLPKPMSPTAKLINKHLAGMAREMGCSVVPLICVAMTPQMCARLLEECDVSFDTTGSVLFSNALIRDGSVQAMLDNTLPLNRIYFVVNSNDLRDLVRYHENNRISSMEVEE